MENKKQRITNLEYRKFLDNGIITIITEPEIHEALNNIKGKRAAEGRALLITLYYTGARPVEVLQLKAKHIKREGSYITIKVPGAKRGLPRTIYLPYRLHLVKELYKYATGVFMEMLLFYHYSNRYIRLSPSKKGGFNETIQSTDKLRYYFKKWFTNRKITPYFLRHNRFSQLTEAGESQDTIMFLKGSKSLESVRPYLHLSTEKAKKVAKKIK